MNFDRFEPAKVCFLEFGGYVTFFCIIFLKAMIHSLQLQKDFMKDIRSNERNDLKPIKKYKFSKKEDVDRFFNAINQQTTLSNGLNDLYNFCDENIVVITHQQSLVLLNIFENYNDKVIIENTLALICKILFFKEEFNTEIFSDKKFLIHFLMHLDVVYSVLSLIVIADSDYKAAFDIISLISENNQINFNILFDISNPNLETNIILLSSLSSYSDHQLTLFVLHYLQAIINLILLANGTYDQKLLTIKHQCLSFFDHTISNNPNFAYIISKNDLFLSMFQTILNDNQDDSLKLNILHGILVQTQEAISWIFNNSILEFIINHLESPDINEVCLSLEVVYDIASYGNEYIQLLYEANIVNKVWTIMLNGSFFHMKIFSLLAILEILKYSSPKNRNIYIMNGFFDFLDDIFDSIPDNYIESTLLGILELLTKCKIENDNQIIANFRTREIIIEQIQSLVSEGNEIAKISSDILHLINFELNI